jgi:hypothetical protein
MEYIMLFWWEAVYELVPGKGMFQTLGVEVMLLEGYSTMATWTLARKYIRITWREMVYELALGVGEMSSVTTWAWRASLDVGGKLVMATINLVERNKLIS